MHHGTGYQPRRRRRRRRPVGLLATLAFLALTLLAREPLFAFLKNVQAHGAASAGHADASGHLQAPAGRALTAPGIAFAPGACVSYAPAAQDRHETVFVDAGHGGPDPGGVGTTSAGATVEEKALTLASAITLRDLLRADGFTVVLSRSADTSVARLTAADLNGNLMSVDAAHRDAQARVSCANAAHARVLISIHFNSAGDNVTGGAETIYDDARPFTAANRRLAQLAQQSLLKEFLGAGWQVPDRGVEADSQVDAPALSQQGAAYGHFLVIGPASAGLIDPASGMPGVITEPLFVTRAAEADVATSAEGQQAIGRALRLAIEAFLT